ncbi:beta-mannosyltransferase 2-like isoform X1 [Silurus meridionalis]|uniref:beta-mannosyltransferase 2-like isoform X1 n=1 Tax=Silurus meridionalis TaxID=175797 RepID=UPI001EEB1AEF|nr:beta-mannosyltransferase 2-like isoform X1 [Silurus meridionalis]
MICIYIQEERRRRGGGEEEEEEEEEEEKRRRRRREGEEEERRGKEEKRRKKYQRNVGEKITLIWDRWKTLWHPLHSSEMILESAKRFREFIPALLNGPPAGEWPVCFPSFSPFGFLWHQDEQERASRLLIRAKTSDPKKQQKTVQ